jgi:very-short-patch-repair endonuclease
MEASMQNDWDRLRDAFMVHRGWSVLRVWNVDVLKDCDAVLDTILAAVEGRLDGNVSAVDLRFIGTAGYGEKQR